MSKQEKRICYEEICQSDLYVDAIYCSPRPRKGGYADDVLTVMFHNCRNTGGFRIPHRDDLSIPYVALHLTGSEPAWPDYFDLDTGILTYYGDNRKGGEHVEKTDIGGNRFLHEIFEYLSFGNKYLELIPPIFVFQNTGEERDVRFLGLAVPGVKDVHEDEYFGTVWRTNKSNVRFPNYVAKFTIVDIGNDLIQRKWIEALMYAPQSSDSYAPKAWLKFKKKGLSGIKTLEAPKDVVWPGKDDQLPSDDDGKKILDIIHNEYGKNNSRGFEILCKKLLFMMDPNYRTISLTRPVKDGGRDAIMEYVITSPTSKVVVECAMEAKCFSPRGKGVGVEYTSRLISRLKQRQFGVFMTTSYIAQQAYEEIVEDGHPVLFCTGRDIVEILRQKANVTSQNIKEWLNNNVS